MTVHIAWCYCVIVMRGKEVLRIRKKLGPTQLEFARRIGVHWTTVSRWERDEVAIPEPAARLMRLLAEPRHRKRGGRP